MKDRHSEALQALTFNEKKWAILTNRPVSFRLTDIRGSVEVAGREQVKQRE